MISMASFEGLFWRSTGQLDLPGITCLQLQYFKLLSAACRGAQETAVPFRSVNKMRTIAVLQYNPTQHYQTGPNNCSTVRGAHKDGAHDIRIPVMMTDPRGPSSRYPKFLFQELLESDAFWNPGTCRNPKYLSGLNIAPAPTLSLKISLKYHLNEARRSLIEPSMPYMYI